MDLDSIGRKDPNGPGAGARGPGPGPGLGAWARNRVGIYDALWGGGRSLLEIYAVKPKARRSFLPTTKSD